MSLLGRVPLLERCSRKELAKIASIAREVEYPAATIVMREGERGSEFFIVVDGEVDIRMGTRKVATLHGGDFFGEIALITGSPRTATATTGSPMRALVIASHDFRRLLRDSPATQARILQEVGERLEELASSRKPQRIRLRD